jgi:hypothetical protein
MNMAWQGWWRLVVTGFCVAGILASAGEAASGAAVQSSGTEQNRGTPLLRPRSTCPAQVDPLVAALLRDLPSYMNRIYLRQVQRRFATASWNYAIAASQPDLNPLPLDPSPYKNPQDENLHQIFFTMLERQYSGKNIVEWQHYHWLFLTQTEDGWRVAILLSRLGPYPSDFTRPMTPIRESSQSLTAEAIRTWLRDCRAGAVRF